MADNSPFENIGKGMLKLTGEEQFVTPESANVIVEKLRQEPGDEVTAGLIATLIYKVFMQWKKMDTQTKANIHTVVAETAAGRPGIGAVTQIMATDLGTRINELMRGEKAIKEIANMLADD